MHEGVDVKATVSITKLLGRDTKVRNILFLMENFESYALAVRDAMI